MGLSILNSASADNDQLLLTETQTHTRCTQWLWADTPHRALVCTVFPPVFHFTVLLSLPLR